MSELCDSVNRKFIESFDVSEWEIETEDGWKEVTNSHLTIKYDVWQLKTKSFELKCADNHIVIVEGFKQKFVKDLTVDDKVITKNGLENVVSVVKLDIPPENMYDFTVDSKNHTFFTNGILSHNTTIATIFLLWYSLFNRDKTVAILANKEATSIEILTRIKRAFINLPMWMQQGIEEGGWNKKSVSLENGTTIVVAGTSSDSISGLTVSLLYIDEFAKIPKHVAEEFYTATYPVISSGKTSKMIIVSTPVGMNLFYELWCKAVKGKSNFFPIKVNWWEVPGRDQQWKKEMIRDIGPVRFAQEFQTKFLGSNSLLIDSDILEFLDTKDPIGTKWNGVFLIYEQPYDATYVLGVDTSKGTGRDYSVIQVLKIKSETDIEQVAVYRNNNISPRDFAQVVISVSEYYNNAFIMAENNDVGQSLCDTIWYEFECEQLLNIDPKGLGIRSTKTTKLNANMLLKDYMEKEYLKLVDHNTITELSRYEETTINVFSCNEGHDDCVTSLLWALYFIRTDFYDGKTMSSGDIDDKYKIDGDDDAPLIIFDE